MRTGNHTLASIELQRRIQSIDEGLTADTLQAIRTVCAEQLRRRLLPSTWLRTNPPQLPVAVPRAKQRTTCGWSSDRGFGQRAGGQLTAEASVLGPRLQRPPVLDLQQPATTPAREVGDRGQVDVPAVWGRVHSDDGAQRAPGARQMQTTGLGKRVGRGIKVARTA